MGIPFARRVTSAPESPLRLSHTLQRLATGLKSFHGLRLDDGREARSPCRLAPMAECRLYRIAHLQSFAIRLFALFDLNLLPVSILNKI